MGEDYKKEDMLENEAEIVERAKTDDKAFETLYNFYFPKIYGYIYKRIGDFDIAQDLLSVTFLKVFINLGKYNHKGSSFAPWIYKIATNNLIDHYRKKGRRKEVAIDTIGDIADKNSNMPDEIFQKIQEKKQARKVLSSLPEKHQRIIHLKFFAEMNTKQIAETLETNENNVRVLIHRALKSFRNQYKKYEGK